MPTIVQEPHSALAAYVGDYVGYDHVLFPDAVHHGLPSPAATVILAFEEPLDTGWVDAPDRSAYWTLAGGLHTRAAHIRTHGRQCGIQLALTPLGARMILGVPLAALAHVVVDHSDLPAGCGVTPAMHARIAASTSWSQRFRLLEEHLVRVVRRNDRTTIPPEITEAWRLLLASRGRLRVDAVARHVGWSRRYLGERVRNEFGVGPKELGRVIRFDRARRLAAAGMRLAEVAYVAGYTDQAHLNRDWRALAGQTPRETLAEQFAFIQDSAADSG